jgi:hypothetical protein
VIDTHVSHIPKYAPHLLLSLIHVSTSIDYLLMLAWLRNG